MTDSGGSKATRLSGADRQQLAAVGISSEEAERQLALLSGTPPATRLDRPCVVGDGVSVLGPGRQEALLARGAAAAAAGRLSKFVPASGAASRMFKELRQAMEGESEVASDFAGDLERYPFVEELRAACDASGVALDRLLARGELTTVIARLLDTPGLGYADLPKGLLEFHRYPDGARTAFEEHLVEAVDCVRDARGRCRLHFTVSEEHLKLFEGALEELRPRLLERYQTRFEVGFSTQSPSTDTLAVDLEKRPFRLEDGRLLLRPGGHGALIRNLAAMDGDLVLIKNIDNVVPDAGKELVCRWKRLLTGCLVELQERTFEIVRALEGGAASPALLAEGLRFVADSFQAQPSDLVRPDPGAQRAYLLDRLDRPLRVCGVVKAAGEPGGGPFWVEGADGELAPQIVEQSQVDLDDERQRSTLASATHFNPVDLVCGTRDHRGEPYDLERFIDPEAVFIARRSLAGRELDALERPGLWNGAMARWNTLFVEVPPETFAPVKTVFDLLRPAHQPGGA